MYKVWKVEFKGSYGGGMGLVAAESAEEAAKLVADYYADDLWEGDKFEVTRLLSYLKSDKKGYLDHVFYIE